MTIDVELSQRVIECQLGVLLIIRLWAGEINYPFRYIIMGNSIVEK